MFSLQEQYHVQGTALGVTGGENHALEPYELQMNVT